MEQQKRFLVEWYRPELTVPPCERSATALCASAARLVVQGVSVRLESMLAVPADEALFGIFSAESVEAVAMACEGAGMPAQRLTAATDIHLPPRA
ncbi:hypothetical protein MSAS_18660 [Mycobacterium saskatchewanense]|uniref:DUF4242 domain-containing protein n=1 Tax=Mycobacterium saskatchewanense TaxID=220927 RepID=A0AAJ3TUS6_9MYCO|nr:hypothetical protein [Mycobacterium saskatchewanense]ORW71133.1 hypothetical protein AWC23_01050 [Mycobacterium saskatchewanense]BBX62692.1 hypothetical protein MSAS_18660 [Mycobacterium saskatchewanense]